MTELLFQVDSYLKEFDATVVEINQEEKAIILDLTALYPGGDGQPNDVGMIFVKYNYLPATKIKNQEGLVLHWIDGSLPEVGSMRAGHITWDYRYKLIRT